MAFKKRNSVQGKTYHDEQVGDVLLDRVTNTFRSKTEEELVRQELLQRIVDPSIFGWPQDLIEVEFKLTKIARSADRADIVLFVPSTDIWQGRNNRPIPLCQ